MQVYSGAIAATSDKMRALVQGGMKEAEKRCATLQDIETEDFIRFYEYALRGDYTVPPCSIDEHVQKESATLAEEDIPEEAADVLPEPQPEPEPEPTAPPDPWDINMSAWPSHSKKKSSTKKAKDKASLRRRLNRRDYKPFAESKAKMLLGFEPQSNMGVDQDFTPVLLAHARLYTFAESNLIDSLDGLALHKIQRTLMDFHLYHARITDIIDLARYAYAHNQDRKDDGTVDRLRQLVVDYIACEIDIIGNSKEWDELIEDGGEFVVDFWRVAREYRILA